MRSIIKHSYRVTLQSQACLKRLPAVRHRLSADQRVAASLLDNQGNGYRHCGLTFVSGLRSIGWLSRWGRSETNWGEGVQSGVKRGCSNVWCLCVIKLDIYTISNGFERMKYILYFVNKQKQWKQCCMVSTFRKLIWSNRLWYTKNHNKTSKSHT